MSDTLTKAEEIKAAEIMQVKSESTPNALLQMAISNKLPIEHLEWLMALKKEWDKDQAKKAFDEAMCAFQSKCPIIKKTKEGGRTKAGDVVYKYASIESIVEQTKDLIAECGFSYLIKVSMANSKVEVSCEVRHVMGHSETSVMAVPLLTQTGVMSDAQVVAGTSTFAKRYAFCNAFGIMTSDEDNDGVGENEIVLFEEITAKWRYCDDYINKIASTVNNKRDFLVWLGTLPSTEQADKFITVMDNLINKDNERQLWNDFQKQKRVTADAWISKLQNSKLIKKD